MAPKGRGRQQSVPAAPGTSAGSTAGGSVGDPNANAGGTVGAGTDNPSDDTSSSQGQPAAAATIKPRTRGSSEPRTPSSSAIQQQEQRFGKRGSGQAFALGLFQILKTEDPSIIGWSPSGKAFRIEDSERFCRDIMPRFFKQNKYSSFQRQLNLYGFRKLVRGEEAGGYMHPLFERGKPEQLSQVRRGFFPEIPPEFAHDVHGHGLSESAGDNAGGASNGSHSRAAPRGRKAEPSRANAGSTAMSTNGPGSRAPAPAAGGVRSSGPPRARSSSVGRSGRMTGLTPAAAAAAAAAVTAVSVPPSRCVLSGASADDHHQGGRESPGLGGPESPRVGRSHGDGAELRGPSAGDHGGDGMAMDTEWDGIDGPLPSLDSVTGGLGLPRGHVNAVNQAGGAELPPTLGRLVPSAESPLSRESSPLKGSRDSDARIHGDAHRGHGSIEARERHDGPIQYGRSQDDLSLSPRTNPHFPAIMGMYGVAGYDGVGGMKAPGGYYNGSNHGAGLAAAGDYLGSNGSIGSGGGSARRGHRLQHMHSRDDLDTLRPRKTRRTGASFQGQADDDGHEAPAFFAGSPRRREGDGVGGVPQDGGGGGGGGGGGSSDNGIPFLAAAAVYATPDEVPPAPPRRLVSHHNTPTPSRPERPSRGNGKGGPGRGGEGGAGGAGTGSEGKGVHVAHLDTNAMDTDTGTSGGMTLSKGFNLAASGFYATVSPVAVGAARGSFPGGRRHPRHPSNGAVQHGSAGSGPSLDSYGGDGQHRGSGWKSGEGSPDLGPTRQGESPTTSRPSGGAGGGSGGGAGGCGVGNGSGAGAGGGAGAQGPAGAGGGMGGLGLTAHAMSRMEQVKASRQDNMGSTQVQADGAQHPAGYRNGAHVNGAAAGAGVVQHGVNGVGVQALGEDLSQLDLGETRGDHLNQAQGADGMPNRSKGPTKRGLGHDNPDADGGSGGGGHKRAMGTGGSNKGNCADWGGARRPAAAEAAELLRRRSSVDEVIGLLSKSTGDNGSFEDESMKYQHDPAQFDSWRNSLTKVLGHLGFDLEDEQGVPQGTDGKRSPTDRTATRGGSQYLSWGGTAAMSFEDQPAEFHESLRQIPMRWRSSLSSIMTSMASNGGGLDDDGGNGADGARGLNVDAGSDGKGGGVGAQGKRLEQQASLEMLQSVMRETLESMSTGGDHVDAEDGEEEAKAAAAAALAMGSMCRANTNDGVGVGSVDAEMGDMGREMSGPGRGGRGASSLGGDVLGNAFDSPRPLTDGDSHSQSTAPLDHGHNSHTHLHAPRRTGADSYYNNGHGGQMQGGSPGHGQYMSPISVPVSGAMGGVGMPHGDRRTSL